MTILEIRGVERRFDGAGGGTLALQATDLDVAENDFVTILGPSGCGKSTLLRIVAGLDHPTAGEVQLDGQRIEGPGADRGMVFQSYTLFPWLNVLDNVCFGLRERGMPRAQQLDIAHGFIELALAEQGLSGVDRGGELGPNSLDHLQHRCRRGRRCRLLGAGGQGSQGQHQGTGHGGGRYAARRASRALAMESVGHDGQRQGVVGSAARGNVKGAVHPAGASIPAPPRAQFQGGFSRQTHAQSREPNRRPLTDNLSP